MKKNSVSRRIRVAALSCLLLSILVLASACSSSPGPGAQPNSTPSYGGYSIIYQVLQDVHLLQALWQR
jgi:hypothetical protein